MWSIKIRLHFLNKTERSLSKSTVVQVNFNVL